MADMQPGKRPPSMTIGNSTASATRSSTVLKRTSTAHPKPSSLAIDPSTLIAQHAVLTGTHPIAIGSDVVLHPHSKVSSTYAPVTLRDGVVVFERAHVGVLAVPTPPSHGQYGLVLDKYVVIETGAVVEAAEVGQGTVVEVGAKLGLGCVIGKFCTITASTVIPAGTRIPDFTVVYSGSERRIDETMRSHPDLRRGKVAIHMKQIELCRKLIANNIAKWT